MLKWGGLKAGSVIGFLIDGEHDSRHEGNDGEAEQQDRKHAR